MNLGKIGGACLEVSGYDSERGKRREEELAHTFDALGRPYVREHTVAFDKLVKHEALTRRAHADFMLQQMPWWVPVKRSHQHQSPLL